MLRVAILISGRGSNMKSILASMADRDMPAEPAVVVSNNPDAAGLDAARDAGVVTRTVPSRGFTGSRQDYDRQIMEILAEYGVTPSEGLVCLAGFMRIIGAEFVDKYRYRIINIHPSLLPSFPGLDAQGQAVEYGVKCSGCTVHFVDSGTDTGPVIMQSTVRVDDGDTRESLARKILKEEHRIYPQVVRLIAEGRISISGRKVVVKSA